MLERSKVPESTFRYVRLARLQTQELVCEEVARERYSEVFEENVDRSYGFQTDLFALHAIEIP